MEKSKTNSATFWNRGSALRRRISLILGYLLIMVTAAALAMFPYLALVAALATILPIKPPLAILLYILAFVVTLTALTVQAYRPEWIPASGMALGRALPRPIAKALLVAHRVVVAVLNSAIDVAKCILAAAKWLLVTIAVLGTFGALAYFGWYAIAALPVSVAIVVGALIIAVAVSR